MALLPLDPSLSRALLAARELGCLQEMLSVAGGWVGGWAACGRCGQGMG